MKCQHVRKSLSRLLDRQLFGAAESAVRDHLARCPGCRQEYESLAAVRSLLASDEAPAPPPYLLARTMAALKSAGPARRPLWQARLATAATLVLVAAGAWLGTMLGLEMASQNGAAEVSVFTINDTPSFDELVSIFTEEE